ncbi:hypothetical protein HanXRQr2_Chr05g0226351 [Helianthus annuus]|uniref:Uncharacterized protein n=1 Tax=Helianthus annuus TaxID=4232 RepID=A0A9K3J309_HELAN|nr:hypothetical protein HanXRQr2_Chr05g0226351 [Helianthus annuus]KAJ0923641.1 hypothetical protein HanPSC8_Chr05g0218441 [Helianthus annuus]
MVLIPSGWLFGKEGPVGPTIIIIIIITNSPNTWLGQTQVHHHILWLRWA